MVGQNQATAQTTPRDPRPDELINRLRQAGLLARLSPDDLRAVLALVRVRSLPAGEVLVTAGSSDTNLYLLRRGKLFVRLPSKDNRDPIVRTAQPGDVLNELAFISGHPSEATIEAVTPAQVWYIPREDFQKLLRQRPVMRNALTYDAENQKYVAQRKRFDTQRPDEVVLWFSRRHWWVFARRLGVPMALLVFSLGLWIISFQQPIISAFVPVLSVVSLFIALAHLSVAAGGLAERLLRDHRPAPRPSRTHPHPLRRAGRSAAGDGSKRHGQPPERPQLAIRHRRYPHRDDGRAGEHSV
jgi:hypothetical protein